MASGLFESRSHIDPFTPMPIDIPARVVTQVRQQRLNASLILRRRENEFSLPVLLGNCVVPLHRHGSDRGMASRKIIAAVQNAQSENCQDDYSHHENTNGFPCAST